MGEGITVVTAEALWEVWMSSPLLESNSSPETEFCLYFKAFQRKHIECLPNVVCRSFRYFDSVETPSSLETASMSCLRETGTISLVQNRCKRAGIPEQPCHYGAGGNHTTTKITGGARHPSMWRASNAHRGLGKFVDGLQREPD